MSIYCVDYGNTLCGIAVADENLKIALPKNTVKSDSLIDFLQSLNLDEKSVLVFGLPISLSGRYSHQTYLTVEAALNIKEQLGCQIYFVDERLTTTSLFNELKGDISFKKIKKTKDQNSSVLILNVFLENPHAAIELKEKSTYKIENDLSSYNNIIIFDVAINNILEKANKDHLILFTQDPWIFWFYYRQGLKSTSLISDLYDQYDLIISIKENEKKIRTLFPLSKLMCL
ncbi:Holliday junction resolvase RuvX [Defluviitoga tunisiensis]|uniref:Putative endonuclease involved in recombination (Possible Holliday junction resolvase in Mycoplasmas and B, subtilis) n=1 Tax=Defluviitoga tunisiensis TaxID=1006576 RepID=A0A0C7P0D4_DEFTU|nr:Holliday junction resolvase RuvX [Defluviitoga tunisiensis]CEP77705.1 putative endonuclease involved in recombination (possible Holliday junction resolvase in Mycoplasmas and B, subtilis) [Defluviitoga tunisiensis]